LGRDQHNIHKGFGMSGALTNGALRDLAQDFPAIIVTGWSTLR
jgi:hypothetical protein